MTKPIIPVMLIGLFLTLIGLEVLFAPDAIIITPAHALAFAEFGRGPLGIILTLTGIYCLWEGYKGSKRYIGVLCGFLNSLFWFLVTLSPLWFGDDRIPLFGFTIQGAINGVSMLAWALITALSAYYYIHLRNSRG